MSDSDRDSSDTSARTKLCEYRDITQPNEKLGSFGSVKCFCLEGMLGRVVDADAGVVHVGVDALLGPDDLDEVGLEGEPLGLRKDYYLFNLI